MDTVRGATPARRAGEATCFALRLIAWSIIALVRPRSRDQVRLFREVWRQTATMTPAGERQ